MKFFYFLFYLLQYFFKKIIWKIYKSSRPLQVTLLPLFVLAAFWEDDFLLCGVACKSAGKVAWHFYGWPSPPGKMPPLPDIKAHPRSWAGLKAHLRAIPTNRAHAAWEREGGSTYQGQHTPRRKIALLVACRRDGFVGGGLPRRRREPRGHHLPHRAEVPQDRDPPQAVSAPDSSSPFLIFLICWVGGWPICARRGAAAAGRSRWRPSRRRSRGRPSRPATSDARYGIWFPPWILWRGAEFGWDGWILLCGAVGELDRGAPRDDGDQGRRRHVQLAGSRVLRHPDEVSRASCLFFFSLWHFHFFIQDPTVLICPE